MKYFLFINFLASAEGYEIGYAIGRFMGKVLPFALVGGLAYVGWLI